MDEVAAHARVGFDGAFEVDSGVCLEGTEVCAAEGLRGDADFKPGFLEGGYC